MEQQSESKPDVEPELEPEVASPDLNVDCLLHLFSHNLNLEDLIPLRAVCRSWNVAICEILQRKRTLKVFQNSHALFDYLDHVPYHEQLAHPFLRISHGPEDDDVVFLGRHSLRKATSFGLFVSRRMPNMSEVVLVVDYWTVWGGLDTMLDALPTLLALYFFLFEPEIVSQSHYHVRCLQMLQCSFNKRSTRLRKLFLFGQKRYFFHMNCLIDRALHCFLENTGELTQHLEVLVIPGWRMGLCKSMPSIRELYVNDLSDFSAFPNLETLRIDLPYEQPFAKLDPKLVTNLKHLQIDRYLTLDNVQMSKLNGLPNLRELCCYDIIIPRYEQPQLFYLGLFWSSCINRTVTHLELTSRWRLHRLTDLLTRLPVIVETFTALQQLTIHTDSFAELDQQAMQSVRLCVPARITVKLVTRSDRFRFMGRFFQTDRFICGDSYWYIRE